MTKAAELAKMGEVLTNNQLGGRRNIVYNGAMQISQRSTSQTGLGAAGDYYTLDRYKSIPSNLSGRFTQSQVAVTDLHGFANALKMECTTADTSIAAGEYFILQQSFEGQDLQQMKKGTSSAEEVTVSFYVKGNANATYVLELYDSDNNRHTSKSFSVTSSWNRVILTYPADTTGTLDDDNQQSLRLFFWLHTGSTYGGGTLDTTWHTTAANRAAGISSFFDSTDRTFFLTGLQMEIGSQATPFEHRSFGEELALCQRYYTVIADGSETNPCTFGTGSYYTATNVYGSINLPTEMRTGPSADVNNGTNYFIAYRNGAADYFHSITLSVSQKAAVEFYNQDDVSGTAGHACFYRTVHGSAKFALKAEL